MHALTEMLHKDCRSKTQASKQLDKRRYISGLVELKSQEPKWKTLKKHLLKREYK